MLLPTDANLRELFDTVRTIAVVGAKDTEGQPVNGVGRYLIEQGYTVVPVHPKRATVWGIPAVKSLDLVPRADLVVLFRAPQYCPDHAREVLKMPVLPRCFWMQEGITSPEARRIMQDAGVMVVEDRCVMVEHRRLAARP